jgi:hypothetical protein
MFDKRTTYTIIDETGDKSTITLDKTVADVLQLHLPDVHAWVQHVYDCAAKQYPGLSRYKRGDLVRDYALKEANKHPEYDQAVREFLGDL